MAMMPGPGRLPRRIEPAAAPPRHEAEAERLRVWPGPPPSATAPPREAEPLESVLDDFLLAWDRGERPRAERYLDRLPRDDPRAAVELIYEEYRLRARDGLRPPADEFVGRFPEHRAALLRLIEIHDLVAPLDEGPEAPPPEPLKPGDEVGPFRLLRELGRGGFARVFLAADTALEDRLVVLKATDRPSAEHRHLARAPHPHIVPILREDRTADGHQLIVMPFLGGATLAEVLAEGRARSRRPELGRELLADLDLRSAPEYVAGSPGRPARELLAALSYAQAVAWIVARLAEGLDHAFARGVTHGDLKPSNILIGGDGQPMLLDFNLSTDWRPASPSRGSGRPGGTLAYMPPERLRALFDPEAAAASPDARHRADLYALGLVLREALTGALPEIPDPSDPPRSARALAALLAERRCSGDPCCRGQLPSIPAGLRAILRRCLAPDPADRYARSSQLAADLDRWRTGRPLLHATPPAWVEASRRLRAHRRPLLAALLCVALGLAASGAASRLMADRAALLHLSGSLEDERASAALRKYHAFVSDPDSGSYAFGQHRRGRVIRHAGRTEAIRRALAAYGLVDRDPGLPWDRQEILRLAEPDRSDAMAWICGQVLMYAIAVSRDDFDGHDDDRRQALGALERLDETFPSPPLRTLALHLRTLLGEPAPGAVGAGGSTAPRWLDAYLEGIVAESLEPGEARRMGLAPSAAGLAVAIERYGSALSGRPDLFWARYRLASVCSRVGEFEAASRFYDECLARRPGDAVLLIGKGTSQYYLGRPDAAISSYRRAVAGAPRWAVAWRELALLGARLGRRELVEEAIRSLRGKGAEDRVEVWRTLRADLAILLGDRAAPFTGLDADEVRLDLESRLLDDPSALELRCEVGRMLLARGEARRARDHFGRVLELEPRHLAARFDRAVAHQRLGDVRRALEDYRAVAEDANVSDLIDLEPTVLMAFVLLSADEARRGRADRAIRYADEAARHAARTGEFRGESSYALARAYAAAAEDDPSSLLRAAEALAAARRIHPGYIEERFYKDPLLMSRRAELATLIGGVEF